VHTLPLIYPSLIDEFGWTAAQMTLPATVFYIFGALASPPAGVLLDRFSPRTVMRWGIACILLCLFGFSFIQTLWQLVLVFFLFGLALSLCGLTANMVILTRWFDHQRGRATGLLLLASSLGGALFPLVLGAGLERYGWRGAILIMSVIGLLFMVPALAFLVKDRPVSARVKDPLSTKSDPSLAGPSLIETLKNPVFYLIAVATGCVWFSVIALLQHQSIYLVKDLGVASTIVPKIFSVFFIFSVFGKLCFGWLSDLVNKEITMILSVLTFTASLFLLKQASMDDTNLLFIYAGVAGFGFSGSFTAIQLLIAQHFSGGSYGKILSLLVMIDSLVGALGTRVVAQIRDHTQSYIPAINTMIAVCLAAIICTVIIKLLSPSE